MAFGSFSSPASSPIIKGKFFSRLTPTSSTASSPASSPTSLQGTPSSSSLMAAVSPSKGATKSKTPTLFKLAAASHKLSLSGQSFSDQKEAHLPTRTRQQRPDGGESDGTSPITSPSGRALRSPTMMMAASSAMDTIFEEDGFCDNKTSYIGDGGADVSNDATCSSSRVSTFSPGSTGLSGNGNNSLIGGRDNEREICDDGTNFESFSERSHHSQAGSEEEGAGSCKEQSFQGKRRVAALSSDDIQELAAVTDQVFQSSPSSKVGEDDLRRQKLLTFKQAPSSDCSFKSPSTLSYSRSKTLPSPRSITDLRSKETASVGRMTKSGQKLLSRTTSVSSIANIPGIEDRDREKCQWPSGCGSEARLRSDVSAAMEDDKNVAGMTKNTKAFPAHIQRMVSEQLQMTVESSRRRSPLALHQLRSPQRSKSLKVSSSQPQTESAQGGVVSRLKQPEFSRSISDPATEDKQSNNIKSISPRKFAATTPEKTSIPTARGLVR